MNSFLISFHFSYFQLKITLNHIKGSLSSLAELEVYVSEDPDDSVQTDYCNAVGSAVILQQEDPRSKHEFDEVGYDFVLFIKHFSDKTSQT